MYQNNRRVFILHAVVGASALAAAHTQAAEETEKVTEADPYARSMGFRLDTAQADKTKYPRHDVAQYCGECQLFSGAAGDAVGACSFYGGRLVPVKGWCRNFKVKKAKA
jgi:hypothetical protein